MGRLGIAKTAGASGDAAPVDSPPAVSSSPRKAEPLPDAVPAAVAMSNPHDETFPSLDPVSWCLKYPSDSTDDYHSLYPFHFINKGIGWLKETYNDGNEWNWQNAGAYLGFRLISYSGIPMILNALSILVSGVIYLIGLLICHEGLQAWSTQKVRASTGYLAESAFDFTCDFRQITGRCICAPESRYLQV